ncbi:hypothetical protein [Amycolatopsis taiwanensis]|uniref:Uncharacterized protein n=1 Tax=Amycolatopsis taiwanensis TaxID=342230 RepID=A0A9W6R178_9PSEU|nr:hypothetical protein [Amycolatopsis taiwanensis]GLY66781.1 hypothetical protein Atai01_34000 [Amycolatopsis taiwanensis]
MVTAADTAAMPARTGAAHRTRPSGWVLRAVISAHVVAIFGQPVFAGVFLSGDYDGLRWHAAGANVVTSIGYIQLIAAIVVWVRLRQVWVFLATFAVVTAETVQYFAGLEGALWLHLPLGVITIAALVVQFIDVWWRPLQRRPQPQRQQVRTLAGPHRPEASDA